MISLVAFSRACWSHGATSLRDGRGLHRRQRSSLNEHRLECMCVDRTAEAIALGEVAAATATAQAASSGALASSVG